MDDIGVSQVEGEPPIYLEMESVPMPLEKCILNSEEDLYPPDQRTYNGDDLSAEDINNMILINEGEVPNSPPLSHEETSTPKYDSSYVSRKSYQIKELLTSDLPRKQRFLSTKSLKKLNGPGRLDLPARKRRFTDFESDDDENFVHKKQRKNSLEKKMKHVRELEERAKFLKQQTKDLLKLRKKQMIELEKDVTLLQRNKSKSFMQRILQEKPKRGRPRKNPELLKIQKVKKSTDILRKKDLKSSKKLRLKKAKDANANKGEMKKLKSDEMKKKVLKRSSSLSDKETTAVDISRSGRIRKAKSASNDFVTNTKAQNDTKPADRGGTPEASTTKTTRKREQTKPDVSFMERRDSTEISSTTQDLQSALSESVESWFDFHPDTKKGKKILKAVPKKGDELAVSNPEKPEYPADAIPAESSCTKATLDKKILNKGVSPSKQMVKPKFKPKNKPNKITSFTKKRRYNKNPLVSKGLKNYGAKIDFGVKESFPPDEAQHSDNTEEEIVVNENDDWKNNMEMINEGTEKLTKRVKVREVKVVKGEITMNRTDEENSDVNKEDNSVKKKKNDTHELKVKGIEIIKGEINIGETDERNSDADKSQVKDLNKKKNDTNEQGMCSSKNDEDALKDTQKKFKLSLEDISQSPECSEIFSSINNIKEVFETMGRGSKDRRRRCHSVELSTFKKVDHKRFSLEMPDILPSHQNFSEVEPRACRVTLRDINVKNDDRNIKELEVSKGTKEKENVEEVSNVCNKEGESTKKKSGVKKQTSDRMGKEEEVALAIKVESDAVPTDIKTQTPMKEQKHHKTPLKKTKKEKSMANEKPVTVNMEMEESVVPKTKKRKTTDLSNLTSIKREDDFLAREDKDDRESRRRSVREIKVTAKVKDLLAHKTKGSAWKTLGDEPEFVHPFIANKQSVKSDKAKEESKEEIPETLENYLQAKINKTAMSFECSWKPGDLVWARFLGYPFWPAVVLGDPFNGDQYNKVKYLGRLPRLFVHVQFLGDKGHHAWGPEIYLMSYNGMDHYNTIKSNLDQSGKRKDGTYQSAFNVIQRFRLAWNDGLNEAEILATKTSEDRVTYMMIKYPLIKYKESVKKGQVVPNIKLSPSSATPKNVRKRVKKEDTEMTDVVEDIELKMEPKSVEGEEVFECKTPEKIKENGKITLKIVRSPKTKKKTGGAVNDDSISAKKKKALFGKKKGEDKLLKKKKKAGEVLEGVAAVVAAGSRSNKKKSSDEEYNMSDTGSTKSGRSSPTPGTSFCREKKIQLFKGAGFEKVCLICYDFHEEKLLKCKGVCQGLYHMSCVVRKRNYKPPTPTTPSPAKRGRKKKIPEPETTEPESNGMVETPKETKSLVLDQGIEPTWKCDDCKTGHNPCFVCRKNGGVRIKCSVGYCGKFYHQQCLKLYPQTILNQAGSKGHSKGQLQIARGANADDVKAALGTHIQSCPHHVCHTCASDNPLVDKTRYMYEKLVKCVECPVAYHGGNYCVPAGSQILSVNQIICGKHEEGLVSKKTHINISWCFICNMGGSLICCDLCPSSFHLDCLNMKQHPEGAYICEECESGRFPLHGEVVWVKLGVYRWWPARTLYPQEVPKNIWDIPHKLSNFAVKFYGSNDHFWLNRGRVFLYQEGDNEQRFNGQKQVDKRYRQAVIEATKDFERFKEERQARRVQHLTSTSNPKPPPYVKLKTNKAVGKVQIGNVSQTEPAVCECNPGSEAPCSPQSDCLNRMLLQECHPEYCNAGRRCGNQCFQKREYPPLTSYRTETRGWGLRSSEDLVRGQFVIEYVGEVIDDTEYKRRMKWKQEAKDNNYYFLTIDWERIIDAGPKGNLARFMNHSCSPNCETQKWTVDGDTRVGLFALDDIPAGTELTFNYNLDCAGNEKKECMCGGENCSGFLGVKSSKVQSEKTESGRGKARKSERADWKESEDECYICRDGGELVVCDSKDCPKVYHLECVSLKEWPNELWHCPRHKCSECGRATKRCCQLCSRAFCAAHTDGYVALDPNGLLYCADHVAFASLPTSNRRRTYERPFAEKYRPPPRPPTPTAQSMENEILMEPGLKTDTPILVENQYLVGSTCGPMESETIHVVTVHVSAAVSSDVHVQELPMKRKKRTNIPRKKIYGDAFATESVSLRDNFESMLVKTVEEKILNSNLDSDNIYNIIAGGSDNANGDKEPLLKKENNESEVDKSRRTKYFKRVSPGKNHKTPTSQQTQEEVRSGWEQETQETQDEASNTKNDGNSSKKRKDKKLAEDNGMREEEREFIHPFESQRVSNPT